MSWVAWSAGRVVAPSPPAMPLGAANGGTGDADRAGALVGLQNGGTLTASYGFGAPSGETSNTLGSPPGGITHAVGLNATNAGDEWDADTSGTLGAWDFGGDNQPPALFYSDYDGTLDTNDINYCARFARANIRCATLIPGQRTATTPQIGSGAGNIQLTDGDTARGITGNITLPAFTVGSSNLELTWSIVHDPETNEANRVRISNNTLQMNSDGLTSRRIVLRATIGTGNAATLVNDYYLKIVQEPNLELTSTVDDLEVEDSHTFTATHLSSATLTWRVTDTDGNPTDLATIDANGQLTAHKGGTVKVIARVEQDETYAADTASHTVTLDRLPANLLFGGSFSTSIPLSGGPITLSATTASSATITWSVSDASIATLSGSDRTAILTPLTAGSTVTITAEVPKTETHAAASRTISITINALRDTNLRFTGTQPATLVIDSDPYPFTAVSDNDDAMVVWRVANLDGSDTSLATIGPDGRFTALAGGQVQVIATVGADTTWSSDTASYIVTLLLPANLRFTAMPEEDRLQIGQSAQFSATREGSGELTWHLSRATTGNPSPAATIDDTGLVTATTTAESVVIEVTAAATATHAADTLTTTLEIADFVDIDGDGLIEIYDLTMLHNMRYDLRGRSYKTATDAPGITTGCPMTGCNGYELMRDLDFDKDGDGSTWSGDSTNGWTLDAGDSQAPYFVTANGGWEPLGNCGTDNECSEQSASNDDSVFTANLNGNGFVIRNLAVQRDMLGVGFIGIATGTLRNLGLEQALADYTGNTGFNPVALLAGSTRGGSIINCHASGTVDGGGDQDIIGGLAGFQTHTAIIGSYANATVYGRGGNDVSGGLVGWMIAASIAPFATIIASHATGAVYEGVGDYGSAGGLVGFQSADHDIIASYATGAVDGGNGTNDAAGGLVGAAGSNNFTIASYATGAVSGGNGASDTAGGLVGEQREQSIIASYAIGAVSGGNGTSDTAGGLAGSREPVSSITASYATGAANSGTETGDAAGKLVGSRIAGVGTYPLTASYGFGTATGTTTNSRGSSTTATTAAGLTAGMAAVDSTNAGNAWNQASRKTLNAWDFGDANQPPALFYNDYDGNGGRNYCALFARANIPCGTLIPGQRSATTPQFGSGEEDIQLAAGDLPVAVGHNTAQSVTGDITLPATFTVGGNPLDLTWSVHHDPEMNEDYQARISGNTLQVNSDGLTSRRIILRATTGMDEEATIVNDYRIRIMPPPSLRFTSTIDTLRVDARHTFTATSPSSAAVALECHQHGWHRYRPRHH